MRLITIYLLALLVVAAIAAAILICEHLMGDAICQQSYPGFEVRKAVYSDRCLIRINGEWVPVMYKESPNDMEEEPWIDTGSRYGTSLDTM